MGLWNATHEVFLLPQPPPQLNLNLIQRPDPMLKKYQENSSLSVMGLPSEN